ncbi:efflux transporter outer membrane subunit [Altericroceibacterium spongiae]|uniref:Efflux transporter outer membrane subunit n=1 Tax=Altericroceibacterium spongiae TaxID=2320269 RepID=A0A420EM20_9SPHN|nr:efflux transporter outer membrane subunit [Altericroceibacterium spongiae]RKF21755.1 efflux transporter outer membrane subunit [Altericroceibacterium spongiae]
MRYLAIPASMLLLSACTVGPDYAGPPDMGSASGDKGQGFLRGGDVVSREEPPLAAWWEGFDDPTLTRLEKMAILGNPDLGVARARLNQARASLRLEKVAGFPTLSAQGVYGYIRVPGLDLGGEDQGDSGQQAGQSGDEDGDSSSDYNIYNLGLQASWEVDLFGGQRRKTESAVAQMEAAEAGVADAQVSLTSAVAQAYFNLRDRQQRIALGEDIVRQRQKQRDLMQQRFDLGTGARIEVEQAQTALEQAQSDLLPLRSEATGFANALAILTGQVPGAVDALLEPAQAIPLPPAQVSVGDPASLLRRRPDIRAAERQIAARNAEIGVAKAAALPRLSFMGILGVGGTSVSDLTDLDDFTAIAAPMLNWDFLDFGRNASKVDQAEATRDEAEAQYRSTVLGALRDVEDSLADFRRRREIVARLARAEESSARAIGLMQQRFEGGTASRLEVLDAQDRHLALRQALTSARAALAASFVSVEKALGLGWAPDGDSADLAAADSPASVKP